MGTVEMFRPGASVYFVGIKGTGVCALAELMHQAGVSVSGSDTPEVFYTDAILQTLKIPYHENFDAAHIKDGVSVVIHSAAYSAETNPELAEAARRSIPVMKYPDALGCWSAGFDSTGICGVHGKTTTTAMAGVLMRAAGIPAQILAGSAVMNFGEKSTLNLGNKYFIAETCEYRRHFLSFHPKRIILTAVESDHQDCFPDYESIRDAFVDYCRLLPDGGELIYCADDPGANEVAAIIEKEKSKVILVPYGFTASGDYIITSFNVENKESAFTLAGIPGAFKIRIPGRHQALNAAAALALTVILAKKEYGIYDPAVLKSALVDFEGSKRRSEILGEAGGVIFMDDYGHHPSAIKTSLAGIKSFYPSRRLIVSFMPHTYTRTSALLEEFAHAFNDADILFLHKIYASAREKYSGGVTGKTLSERIAANRSAASSGAETLIYTDEPEDAFEPLCKILKPGDLFITVGAGNNWPLGKKLFDHYKSVSSDGENHD
ncbi:MAG: UDP-N-acetylmuramate--L-alanine ligase [Treponema sp.]|jgi:UDP-N-acetylmuramate--alanine ligase|nr:UDP-N-acetylmuramate--L-alanine ligase [Treponema sp.]